MADAAVKLSDAPRLTNLQLRDPVDFFAPESRFYVDGPNSKGGNCDSIVAGRVKGGILVPCDGNERPDGFIVSRRRDVGGKVVERRLLVWDSNVLAVS